MADYETTMETVSGHYATIREAATKIKEAAQELEDETTDAEELDDAKGLQEFADNLIHDIDVMDSDEDDEEGDAE